MPDQYQMNSPSVVAEDVDGEVIAINMSTGVYYSMTGWSAWMWNAVVAGARLDTIRDMAPDPTMADAFVSHLEAERLVVARTDAAAETQLPTPPDIAFERFQAERFTDMEDLIMLDPVHDVDASEGWPRAAPIAE